MKKDKNILLAFLLNLSFSLLELVGGVFTGSVAILSDAIHDAVDALSIGISYWFERKSKKTPNATYTYGYARYSVLGGAITTLLLIVGSVIVMLNAFWRVVVPTEIHYDGMLVLSLIGILVNGVAAYFTREGDSVNQKAVNLHMLEDVLGWIVVFLGAVVMRFTKLSLLDPLLSIAVSGYILFHAIGNLKNAVDILLEKAPRAIREDSVRTQLLKITGVLDIHHIHLWTLDGEMACATMHIVMNPVEPGLKHIVRHTLRDMGIAHATIEWETPNETCEDVRCCGSGLLPNCSHHHTHHH